MLLQASILENFIFPTSSNLSAQLRTSRGFLSQPYRLRHCRPLCLLTEGVSCFLGRKANWKFLYVYQSVDLDAAMTNLFNRLVFWNLDGAAPLPAKGSMFFLNWLK